MSWTIKTRGSHQEIGNERQLRAFLDDLSTKADPSAVLIHETGNALSLAVSDVLAHVEFIPASSAMPLLAASIVPPELVSRSEYVDFTIGGTPTRILRDLCVPTKTMVRIAIDYFKNQALPDWVSWIKLDWP